jgi:hypothetical protein
MNLKALFSTLSRWADSKLFDQVAQEIQTENDLLGREQSPEYFLMNLRLKSAEGRVPPWWVELAHLEFQYHRMLENGERPWLPPSNLKPQEVRLNLDAPLLAFEYPVFEIIGTLPNPAMRVETRLTSPELMAFVKVRGESRIQRLRVGAHHALVLDELSEGARTRPELLELLGTKGNQTLVEIGRMLTPAEWNSTVVELNEHRILWIGPEI